METEATYNEHLIRMANQIATFFGSMPEREEAMRDLATHLRKFWEPRMRSSFLAQIDAGHIEGLHPLLLATVQAHRALIC